MNKDPLVFIRHISDAIDLVLKFTNGLTKSDFLKDELVQSGVVRQIEIIGEATKNLPDSFRKKYSSTPWKAIAGMRDKLIHHYFGVDLNYVWAAVKKEIPTLKKQIQLILEENK